MTNSETYAADYEHQCRARKELGQINKAAIFAALAAADIDLVFVSFDGEGDSGQIQDITAGRKEQSLPLPDVNVKLLQAGWGKTEPEASEVNLREAIETLCYDFLADDHAGWENDDGGFGEFRIDVLARSVELQINLRYVHTSTTNLTY